MTYSRVLDTVLAVAIAVAVVLIVMVKGALLYSGLWYYFVVPAVFLGLCAALRTKPFFLLGASLVSNGTIQSVLPNSPVPSSLDTAIHVRPH